MQPGPCLLGDLAPWLAFPGLALATTVGWQTGTRVLGLAFLLAAGLRLSLPARTAGWLVVRTRGLDAAVLLVLGFAMVALAETIPPA